MPLPSNEAFVVLDVVDRAISLVITDVRHQKMDDVVFTDGEADIDLVPISSATARTENELAAEDGLGRGSSRVADREPETLGEKFHAACLVNEVERTEFEGELLVRRQGMARQEYHRQVHAKFAQSG